MQFFSLRNSVIIASILLLIGIVVYAYVVQERKTQQLSKQPKEPEQVPEVVEPKFTKQVIGSSVEKRDIEIYSFGTGEHDLLFVGGIHGGYEWNSVLLSYTLIDYIKEHPTFIPDNLTVHIIPSANPDGMYDIIQKEGRFTLADVPQTPNTSGAGRFNAHTVDLNRNFACNWQPESTWRGNTVSAGTSAFSEPEAQAIRAAVQKYSPEAVLFFHSQSNAVYASECNNGVLPETITIMNRYATAAGYKAVETFDAYEITGDAEGWLASIGIPALTVELATHETVEWERNKQGIEALFTYFARKQ